MAQKNNSKSVWFISPLTEGWFISPLRKRLSMAEVERIWKSAP